MGTNGRKRELMEVGFPQKAVKKTVRSRKRLPSAETYRRKVTELVSAGFWEARDMIAKAPGLLGNHASTIVAKAAVLKDEGITDPVRLLEDNPDLAGLSEVRLRERFTQLKSLGFQRPANTVMAFPNVLAYGLDRIRASVNTLRRVGFHNPVHALELFPRLLRYAPSVLAKKAVRLEKLGIVVPTMERYPGILGLDAAVVEKKLALLEKRLGAGQGLRAARLRPEILGMSISTILERLARAHKSGMGGAKGAVAALGRSQSGLDATVRGLEAAGLDARSVMKKAPSVVSLSASSFSARLKALRKAGIPDPVTAVKRMPTVLTLSAQSVRTRVDWLLEYGFKKPGTMAVRSPGILAANTETLRGRIEEVFSWEGVESGLALAEKEPVLLASSPDKLRTIGAALKIVGGATSGTIRGLLWCSPLDIAYAVVHKPENGHALLSGTRLAKLVEAREKELVVHSGAQGRGPRARCCRFCLAWLKKRSS